MPDRLPLLPERLSPRLPVRIPLLLRLLRYLEPMRGSVALAGVSLLLASAASLAGPKLLQLAIDTALPAGDRGALLRLSLGYLAAELLVWGGTYGQTYFMSRAGQDGIARLREDLFAHLQSLGLDYYDGRPAGVIMSRVTNDVNTLDELLSSGLTTMVGSLLSLVAIAAVMLWQHLGLALLALSAVPLLILVTARFRGGMQEAYRATRQTTARLYGALQEGISGIRVTQAFRREGENERRFEGINRENLVAYLGAERLHSLFMPAVEVVGGVGTVLLMGVGGVLALRAAGGAEGVTIGTLVLFLAYMDRFYRPIRDLTSFYAQLQSVSAASEHIFELLDTPPSLPDPPGLPSLPPIEGRVRFQGVAFAYRPGEPVLRGVDFAVLPGERVALVGPTGAGKSTILSLLARFYDPVEGSVEIDGWDLRRVSLHSLRSQLGVVLQENFLFSGTVAENIAYGRPGASREEVERAAREAEADAIFRRLPRGYDTPVGERGAALSLGQRQLVAVVRALLKEPRLLLLDEATASLDAEQELALRRALERLMKGRTSFVIAHRLSTVRSADRILVIAGGRLVEQGVHAELLARGGLYARLYHSQFGGRSGAGSPIDRTRPANL